MIKRFWFSDLSPDVDPPWVTAAHAAPPATRPSRLTVSTRLDADSPRGAPHARIDVAWFRDVMHHERFARFIGPEDAAGPGATLAAEEVVLRGSAWLDGRWLRPTARYKHLAVARRAEGLTADEFSARWRAHAGTAGHTPIPEAARGAAYVQNHPTPSGREHAYDAVNEVWFDDVDGLRDRIRWFAARTDDAVDDELFGTRHLIAMRESVIDLGASD